MATVYNIDVVRVVDELGEIKARIADLKATETRLNELLKDYGPGAYDGAAYRATVSAVAENTSLDPLAAEEKLRELGVDGRWFSKHQKVRKAYTTVAVKARKA